MTVDRRCRGPRSDRPGPEWADEVRELARRRDAVLLAHNYQLPEIQDVADHVGDSLALSRIAAESQASTIVFCGVHFMAETAKILGPGQDGADPGRARRLLAGRLDHRRPAAGVEGRAPGRRRRVSYVNTTAAVKAETDICCTSSNAVEVVALDPGRPRGAVPARPVPRRARPARSPAGRTCTSGRGSATCTPASTAPTLTAQAQAHPDAELFVHPECGCATSALYLAGTGAVPARPGQDPLHRRHARRRPRDAARRRCWSPPRSGCCTSCAGPRRRSTSGR